MKIERVLQWLIANVNRLNDQNCACEECESMFKQDNISRVIYVDDSDIQSFTGTLEERIAQYINSLNYIKTEIDSEIWVEYTKDEVLIQFRIIDTIKGILDITTANLHEVKNIYFKLNPSCPGGHGFTVFNRSNDEELFNYCGPSKTSDLTNDSGFISCSDLLNCQEIINLQESIPTDVSNLTDNTNLFFDRDYNSLNNLPTIGEGVLQILVNGIILGSFGANSTINETFNFIVPTKTSELTNDAGFVTTDTTYSAGLGLKEVGTEFRQDFVVDGSGDVIDVEQTADGIKVTKGQINYNGLANLPDLSTLSSISTHPTQSNFPVTGENNTVYIAEDTGYMYRWNGTGYTQLTDQTAIWGNISGNILNQIDLVNILALKEDKSNKKNNLSTPNNTDYPTTQAVTDYVGKGELDIQLNGVSLNKFNANQVSNAIANIIAQEPLVSGTNIKTVGGQSLLGSGNIPFPTGLQLGETSSTAYRGDRGKTAYDHSQLTTGNPHNVTKSDVGLGNVDNTSDANKPISTATQAALNGKVDSVTASVGASVDNTDPKNPKIGLQDRLPNTTNNTLSNETPQWYITNFPQSTIVEIKNKTTINSPLGTGSTYVIMETTTPYNTWTGNNVAPVQKITNNGNGRQAIRYAIDNTTWSPWKEVGNMEIVPITYSALKTLKTSNSLTPGTRYFISDRDIWIDALDTNKLAMKCKRHFRIVKDEHYTPHNEVPLGTYTIEFCGIYGQKYARGSTPNSISGTNGNYPYAIWGGRMWVRSTGSSSDVPGTSNEIIAGGWGMIETTNDLVYESKIFDIKYNFDDDLIWEQSDDRGNIIKRANSTTSYMDITDWGNENIYNNENFGIFNNFNNGSIYNNSNIGYILNNSNSGRIFNNSNNSDIGNNSNIGNIGNNSNIGNINTNSNNDYIIRNSNNGNINNNSNNGGISNNSNIGSIEYNSSGLGGNPIGGRIYSNSNSGSIDYNSIDGRIDDNSNNGNISRNSVYDGVAGVFFSISGNQNNGWIKWNRMNDINNQWYISDNTNNGNIGNDTANVIRNVNIVETRVDK